MKNFYDHVNSKHEKLDLKCPSCDEKLLSYDRLQSHKCTRLSEMQQEAVDPVPYQLRNLRNVECGIIRGMSPLQIHGICQSLQLAIPECYPPINGSFCFMFKVVTLLKLTFFI